MEFNRIFDDSSSSDATKYFDHAVGNYFISMFPLGYTDAIVRLRSCFESISMMYKRRLAGVGPRPDWGDKHYRCTYIYRFFTMHCYLVYHSLQLSCDTLKRLWKHKSSLRVCCIGGGPGSDVVGLTKFLRDNEIVPVHRLKCSIIDLYQEWERSWKKLSKN